jgi:hypothetical protein
MGQIPGRIRTFAGEHTLSTDREALTPVAAPRTQKTKKTPTPPKMKTPARWPTQDRGEDAADRQDGAACARQWRSSLVGRFEGCITARRGRCPYPDGRAARQSPPYSSGIQQPVRATAALGSIRVRARLHRLTVSSTAPVVCIQAAKAGPKSG